MKKLIATLLCALLALIPALAEDAPSDAPDIHFEIVPQEPGDATPQPEVPEGGEPTPEDAGPTPEAPESWQAPAYDDTFTLDVNGESVVLVFDSTPEYSSVAGGLVQASYYGYGADGVTLYELYIIFPATAQPGMVITPEYSALTGEQSSVVLIQSDNSSELYFMSSLMNGSVYPTGSDFSVTIEDIYSVGSATTYSGTVSARLIALDEASGEVKATLEIPQTPFSFTLGGGDNRHADPAPTPAPEDMRKA